jgi:hypothetical protein
VRLGGWGTLRFPPPASLPSITCRTGSFSVFVCLGGRKLKNWFRPTKQGVCSNPRQTPSENSQAGQLGLSGPPFRVLINRRRVPESRQIVTVGVTFRAHGDARPGGAVPPLPIRPMVDVFPAVTGQPADLTDRPVPADHGPPQDGPLVRLEEPPVTLTPRLRFPFLFAHAAPWYGSLDDVVSETILTSLGFSRRIRTDETNLFRPNSNEARE